MAVLGTGRPAVVRCVLAAAAVALAAAGSVAKVNAGDAESWPIRCSTNCKGKNMCYKVCSGQQTQTHKCPRQDDCEVVQKECPKGTVPADCELSDWTEWASPIGCSGLCMRMRNISQPNHCGGRPCEGALEDSKACANPRICTDQLLPQDCLLGDWEEWGGCGAQATFQRERRREVSVPAKNGGRDCSGLLTETAACSDEIRAPVDCLVSSWLEWTPCTKKCGGGQRTRLRTILRKARDGGAACVTKLSEMEPCDRRPCGGPTAVNCTVGPWSEWSSCLEGQQRMRRRGIANSVEGAGKACDQSLIETEGCKEDTSEMPEVDCEMSPWAEWHLCDQTCGGGQTFRERRVQQPAERGGEPCQGTLKETATCNAHPCSLGMQSCRVAQWSEWGECSATCGAGQQKRDRTIITEAQAGGLGCYLPLSEVRACAGASSTGVEAGGQPTCAVKDCAWGEWSDWSDCSASCHGGQKRRHRFVKEHASLAGKQCEPQDMLEVAACGEGPCTVEHCTDGKWASWGEWSQCTKTCRGGYRWHIRRVAIEASSCGKAATGAAREAEGCNSDIDCTGDVDCEFSDWSSWGSCSDKCMGTRTRLREIKVHPVGNGAKCGSVVEGEDLEETEACQGEPDAAECHKASERTCSFGQWGKWYECPVTCGGGQTVRTRKAELVAGLPGGAQRRYLVDEGGTSATACEGATKMTMPCSTVSCGDEVDCQYGDWSEWGACTKCGGQQFRHRVVVKAPENGGKECLADTMEETRECPRQCGSKLYYCVWSDWAVTPACTTSCGNGMTFRKRISMLSEMQPMDDPLAVASTQKECTGQSVYVNQCPDNPPCPASCIPQDCSFSPWSDWSAPKCEGLCERTRTKTTNNECGKPCYGPLTSTKHCPADCESKDCQLSEWSAWTTCASETDQKYRSRKILVEPAFSGMGCTGTLNETGSCATGINAPIDCELSFWSDWGDCDKTCGGGQQARKRTVKTQAKNGGWACSSYLAETQPCGLGRCPGIAKLEQEDCQLGPWSLWSKCGNTGNQQALRTRMVAREAKHGGMPCYGRLEETRGCLQFENRHKNCIFSTWSMWSPCSASCGGAQQSRSRSIEAHAKGGGLQCEGALMEDRACAHVPCSAPESQVCKVSEWSRWSGCSATCGEGFMVRQRNITQPSLAGTEGCRIALEEAKSCKLNPCEAAVDCEWGAWAHWSSCVPAPTVCGIGYKRRSRTITSLPSHGGKLCPPRIKEEISPVANCKGQPQCCVDGEWDDWHDWGGCSASCGTGTMKRHRHHKVKETWCGQPAAGPDTQYAGCKSEHCTGDSDCVFSEWTGHTHCSSKCHGSRLRSRHILVNGTGKGMSCTGATESTERCNPADGEPEPFSCEDHPNAKSGPQDCVMTEWSDWSGCSSTCERGYQTRYRRVQVDPRAGGAPCEPSTRELATCHKDVPCFPERTDCLWGDWTKWSECDDFQKRTRTRGIEHPAAKGGLECDGPVSEVAPCAGADENCEASEYTCYWGLWSEWSNCSMTCGTGGERLRMRSLEVGSSLGAGTRERVALNAQLKAIELPALEAKLETWESGAGREKELSVAFALGCGSLVALYVVARGATKAACAFGRRWEPGFLEYNTLPQNP